MVEFERRLGNKPITLMIEVATPYPKKIRVIVKDAKKPFSFYTNRYATAKGTQKFYVRMPISPNVAKIIVKSEDGDDEFKIIDFKEVPLVTKEGIIDFNNKKIVDFITFAEEFSQKAGYLSAGGSTYVSNRGNYRIDYLDDIYSKSGRPLETPARISQSRGIIQVSKEKFKNYTIPMRMAILLHEFSHFYLNDNMADEIEADLNGLLIYLALGYPRIEAFQAFLTVFHTTPTEQNVDRFDVLNQFIANFEKGRYNITYSGKYLNASANGGRTKKRKRA
jgi:hypothetical protein